MIRYGTVKSEAIRKAEGMDMEQFSIAIGYTARAYQKAWKKGTLTYRMAREISQRFKVKLQELGAVDGEKR